MTWIEIVADKATTEEYEEYEEQELEGEEE